MNNSDFKFIEWAEKGILVTIQYQHLFNPYRIVWYADISKREMHGRILHQIDWKDSWLEAYKDAEQKLKIIEMSDIPEIDIKLTSVEVKGGKTIKMTVRNMFYRGFKGKIRTFVTWLFYKRGVTFNEYLDSPVTWKPELAMDVSAYHDINSEKELSEFLEMNAQEWLGEEEGAGDDDGAR
jgi:hypothetical protein